MFDDLDALLKRRKTPDVPQGLNARIIAAAARHEQRAAGVIKPYLVNRIWPEIEALLILRPAVSFGLAVFAVLTGMLIGSSSENLDLMAILTPGDLASFMTIDDSFIVGEWV